MKCYCVQEFGEALERIERSPPTPVGSQVVVRVVAAGVCHSDIHLRDGGYEIGQGRRMDLRSRGIAPPLVLGHESVGQVVELGPEARGVSVGQNYLVYPWIGCGECPACRSGSENHCSKPTFIGVHRDGGYADHIVVPDGRYLLPIGDLDPFTAAPLACSGVTTYGALKKVAGVLRDEPIVIVGAGGLGLMSLGILRAMGGKGAVVVDTQASKRQAALEAGAIAAIDGAAPDALDRIVEAVGGPPGAVVDFVGSEKSAALAFDSVRKGGSIVIVGLYGGATPWPLPMIPIKAVAIFGSYMGNLADMTELVRWAREGRIPSIPVTRRKLDEVNDVLASLERGEIVGRAVLSP